MKASIFGANGQDGFYLSELLKRSGIHCYRISRTGLNIIGDVGDSVFVESHVKEIKPNYIFHFAANSSTCHDVIFENHQSVSTGTLNILEAVRRHSPSTKVFLSGSAMQFKNDGLPIDENTPFDASSPYSVSRIQSVYAARYFRERCGLKVYVGYLFNHDSFLRSERHVNQKIVKAAMRIATGGKEVVELGNIDVKKEFNYAGDVVEAIWVLVNQDVYYEVVIGSGEAFSIKEWIEYCFHGINKNWEDYVCFKSDFISEYSVLVSNPKRMCSLGWRPKIKYTQLADLMMGGHV